jgi:hypothetical protein
MIRPGGKALMLALACATGVTAQQPDSTYRTVASRSPMVIVPWTHFGQPESRRSPGNDPPELRPTASHPLDPPPSDQPAAVNQAAPPLNQAAPPQKSPLVDLSDLNSEYANRSSERNGRVARFQAATEATADADPDRRALAHIEMIRLQIEGEQDRMETSRKLSQAYSALASDLRAQGEKVNGLLQTRQKQLQQAQEQSAETAQRLPELKLALRNLAALPSGEETDDMLRQLDSELTKNEQTAHNNDEVRRQSQIDIQELTAAKTKLEQSAQAAERRVAELTRSADDAQSGESRLADQLEVALASEQADKVLADSQGSLRDAVAVAAGAKGSAPASPEPSQQFEKSGQRVGVLRDCIRTTGDVARCRAQEGSQP